MLDKSFNLNLKEIEVEIITRCNLMCFNCDRACRQAPSNTYMTTEQIEKFINESLKLKWGWKDIGIIGGEPTLHPQFFDILSIIKRYKDYDPKCKIELITNGCGDKVQEILRKVPDWVQIRNSAKTSPVQEFGTHNLAPIDLEEYQDADFTTGCWILEHSGLGLSRLGYYPCGQGSVIDRVFGFDLGIKKLSDLKPDVLRNNLRLWCSLCGHFKYFDLGDPRYWNQDVSPKTLKHGATKQETSISWKRAFRKYKKAQPDLSLY